jgi:hypothetical protein
MEAVTAILRNNLKNTTTAIVVGAILGLLLGLLVGWVLWPVTYTDTTPELLRTDLQEDYLRMAMESFSRTGDQPTAMRRWNDLGPAAQPTLQRLLANPALVDPALAQQFAAAVQAPAAGPGVTPGAPTTPTDTGGGLSTWVILGSLLVLVLVGGGTLYLLRLFRKNSGAVTPVMQGAEISRQVEKTDFQSLGLAQPITQTMTTYVLGDDLYDESFSIDTGGGEFLGEYGVGVSETIGVGEPKKVAALEIWLFDKNDIKTATKVLMTEHAYNDPNIRARLEPKGELVVVKPQEQVLLETATLQLLTTVVDMEYGTGAMPQRSHFERITLELAVWPRSAQ